LMRLGSLFSGYGGVELGLQSVLGGTVAWHCDNDPAAARVLTQHRPDTPNLGDITTVDWHQVAPVDVVTAGLPCPDISHAGTRTGTEGARSGLWTHLVDAVRALRPELLVLENVAALLVRGIATVAADLAACGYDLRWLCLRASDVGAPHRRDRFFAVAHPQGHRHQRARPPRHRGTGPAHRRDA